MANERVRISTVETKTNFNLIAYMIAIVAIFFLLIELTLKMWFEYEKSLIDFARVRRSEKEENEIRYPARKDDGKRIPEYDRKGIVLPRKSDDTVECDDWENVVSKGIHCCLDCGFSACFNCLEARTRIRVCKHLKEDLVLFDEVNERNIVLPKNDDPRMGYCMSKGLSDGLGEIGEDARRKCSIKNADWILARKRTEGDTHYNFLCKCKYPHLLTNSSGLMSPCDKDVGCNGHGHLDANSVAGIVDPFVQGTCICDDGWISDRNDQIGPYCRQAIFEEYPSMFYGRRQSDNDIELNSEEVDINFRSYMADKRRDGNVPVYLPNPCSRPCKLEKFDTSYICTSGLSVDHGNRIDYIGVAVRLERDYLAGNGGAYPNACLVVTLEDYTRVRMQYLSHEWNPMGETFAPDFGFHLTRSFLPNLWTANDLPNYFEKSEYQQLFSNDFIPLNQRQVINDEGDDSVIDTPVIWLYNDSKTAAQNVNIWYSLVNGKTGPFEPQICLQGDRVKIGDYKYRSFYVTPEKVGWVPGGWYHHYVYQKEYVCGIEGYYTESGKYRRPSDYEIGSWECGQYQSVPEVVNQICFDCQCECGTVAMTAEDLERIIRWLPSICLNTKKGKGMRLPEINTQDGNDNPYGMVTLAVDYTRRQPDLRFNSIYETRWMHVPKNFDMKRFFKSRGHGWVDKNYDKRETKDKFGESYFSNVGLASSMGAFMLSDESSSTGIDLFLSNRINRLKRSNVEIDEIDKNEEESVDEILAKRVRLCHKKICSNRNY